MKEKDFNLLEEPWIRVLMPDCTVREVSLTDALLHAQEYADLAGELPTQDVAVLRLLLAVLQTVFSRVDVEGQPAPFHLTDDALLRWKSLWQLGRFPEKPVCSYLEKWRERFWLFHPERPFWQVPEAKIGSTYKVSKLNGEISESENKNRNRLFAGYSRTGKTEMTYAQAARWLLHINGYDDTSAKPKDKAKDLPSIEIGWVGQLGLIMAKGRNLFETLMLNLVFLEDGESFWGEQKPCWELEEVRSGERTEIPQPDNAAQLLTLQSRRLLLHRENDGKVTKYSLLGGDFFDKENAFCEQMTVWKNEQTNKNTPVTSQPLCHDPSRQFWREFPSVFTQQPNTRQPGIVRWLTKLQIGGLLDTKKMIQFQMTGIKYGPPPAHVFTDTFSDSLSFHALLLDELGQMWRNKITEEIGRCEKLAVCLYDLAKDLAIAAGGDSKSVSNAAAQQFYFQIDQPFRDWLYTIDPDWDDEKSEQNVHDWQAKAKQIARRLGEQLVLSAGNAAFIGRSITKSGKRKSEKKIHYSAPEAYNHFLFQIKKIYAE